MLFSSCTHHRLVSSPFHLTKHVLTPSALSNVIAYGLTQCADFKAAPRVISEQSTDARAIGATTTILGE